MRTTHHIRLAVIGSRHDMLALLEQMLANCGIEEEEEAPRCENP